MRDAESGNLTHQPGRVNHFLDFRRAYPITRRFNHLVAAADEVKITFLVAPDGIARPDRHFRHDQAAKLTRHGFEALGGFFNIVPITQ